MFVTAYFCALFYSSVISFADGNGSFAVVMVGGVLEANKTWDIEKEVVKCIKDYFLGACPVKPQSLIQTYRALIRTDAAEQMDCNMYKCIFSVFDREGRLGNLTIVELDGDIMTAKGCIRDVLKYPSFQQQWNQQLGQPCYLEEVQGWFHLKITSRMQPFTTEENNHC